jgi:hypothetical protein
MGRLLAGELRMGFLIFDLSARRLEKQFSVWIGPDGSGWVRMGPDFWLAVPE